MPEAACKSSRTQRFDQTLNFLSAQFCRIKSKKDLLQIRSSAWIYLFDLATCPEQLERISGKFSQFVESGRQFRDQHVTAFVRRCTELQCPQLALAVFSQRPAYRMDLTLPAARRLLYAIHEERQLADVVTLAALFPLYNLPALSSDPISCALLISACLREVHNSGSGPAWTVAATLLSPFKQLLAQTPPMPVSVETSHPQENFWMKYAMLNIIDSFIVRGEDASWVREWCMKSGYGFSRKIS
ncbi:hypothetical protein BJV78DRAFT_1282171 [Lactifluus subvellereus]|nr:hypothetical protein BJV78DRAFT_1282171 [Lactifluus subvellereus]